MLRSRRGDRLISRLEQRKDRGVGGSRRRGAELSQRFEILDRLGVRLQIEERNMGVGLKPLSQGWVLGRHEQAATR